jgi:hypothetical protein
LSFHGVPPCQWPERRYSHSICWPETQSVARWLNIGICLKRGQFCNRIPPIAGLHGIATVPASPLDPPLTAATPRVPGGAACPGTRRGTPPKGMKYRKCCKTQPTGKTANTARFKTPDAEELNLEGVLHDPLISRIHRSGAGGKGFPASAALFLLFGVSCIWPAPPIVMAGHLLPPQMVPSPRLPDRAARSGMFCKTPSEGVLQRLQYSTSGKCRKESCPPFL